MGNFSLVKYYLGVLDLRRRVTWDLMLIIYDIRHNDTFTFATTQVT